MGILVNGSSLSLRDDHHPLQKSSKGLGVQFIIYLLIILVHLGALEQWSLWSITWRVALGLLHVIGFVLFPITLLVLSNGKDFLVQTSIANCDSSKRINFLFDIFVQ
ncbi:hypothetical protein J1N35_005948 [Gossypium stocksii]|uniref:Uncharacterized protein n=1 Tax=Gossypium stocksii TaxID=47602 RepID=A0A9D3WFE1_9ROSI|nr:hypothetical protein J1N35_005948 [Gossypium stocksii]